MTDKFYKWLCSLIASGDVHPFYCSSQWVRLSHKVLDMDKHECQLCKERGLLSAQIMKNTDLLNQPLRTMR